MAVKMTDRTLEEKILLGITATATLILFPFLITSILSRDIPHIIVDFIAVFGIFAIFLGVWFTRRIKLYSGIFAVLAHVNILIGIYIKGQGLIYWLFPIIIGSFYLLPTLMAILFNFALISVACLFTYQQFDSFTLPRIIAAFIVTNIFSLIFSVFMKNQNRRLSEEDNRGKIRNSILELVASSSELSKVLSVIIEGVENEFPETICSVLLRDKTGKHLVIGAAPHLPDFFNEALEGLPIEQGVGSCGEAVYTGKRVIVADIASDAKWASWASLAKQANFAACWSEPIIDNQGQVLGTFAIYYRKITTPTTTEFKVIEQFVNLARIAIERQKADQLIWQQANYDSLTNLPNRNLLHEHLMSAIANSQRDKKQLAIAMLDLDKFKHVNDTLGHGAGDFVLVECAKRIKGCIRKNDIAARLGGDEFIVVLVGTTTAEDIDKISHKLSKALAEPYYIYDQQVSCTASIGLAIYPNDGLSMDDLLKNADQAMYCAKTNQRKSVCYYKDAMSAR
ncbi:sensor domain-containing diguanylate cyclase [Amphritea sp. 2_MG-2023]|uniref:sensor domain-containing diguanylate cyclase n=1 Tax=Amphritea TaxID=515417 RepID=UPI001C06626E|nr:MULTISPECIES: sensor domain-containing diguanylate cyclase [Amphritea]MBU2965893.1 sensor domain-containing diguanylate cyclase [Amphritea atlantica]MDO6417983.1 sensor domain-containing diguanylate cyclase [Amphritea sp. 2_MG-2023]